MKFGGLMQRNNCIKGHFIFCGRYLITPFDDGTEDRGWIPSYVRLDKIKSVNEYISPSGKSQCTFIVADGEWYGCDLSMRELVEAINDDIDKKHQLSSIDERSLMRECTTGGISNKRIGALF
jgi:hypothetical protein